MSKRILIVDDEKNIRMTLKHCLVDQNYDIDMAVNGDEALDLLENSTFDLVLLDIKMPGLDGMKVLEHLRNNGNDVTVIMMTAYGTVENAVEAMKMGAVDFISKPFTPDEIRNIVINILNRSELKQTDLSTFKDYIEFSKKCILAKDYVSAEIYLKKAIDKNIDAPEPHNLMGVISELRNDLHNAQIHYRAALSLDPTYHAADVNLQRTVQYKYDKAGITLGDD